jgi:uncharacterized protein (DUF433 family)
MASLDWSQCPVVESIPGKVTGENLEAGANLDDITEWFDGLDREQVRAVIGFAVRSLGKEPVYAP